jgi:hypothetical protein
MAMEKNVYFWQAFCNINKPANKLLFPPKKITAQKSGYFFVIK